MLSQPTAVNDDADEWGSSRKDGGGIGRDRHGLLMVQRRRANRLKNVEEYEFEVGLWSTCRNQRRHVCGSDGIVETKVERPQSRSGRSRAHQRQRARNSEAAVSEGQSGEGAAAAALCQRRRQRERSAVVDGAIMVQAQI